MAVGAYPGSFNPPTVAHLAIAEAARDHAGLERVDLVVSEAALGKEGVVAPSVDDRVAVLEHVAASRPWLGVRRSRHQLIADLAADYDVVVVGADKWLQMLDPAWYGGSLERRDEALRRLPRVLVAPRAGYPIPASHAAPGELLALTADLAGVSSTGARAGRLEWMLAEAADLDRRTGVWTVTGSSDGGREAP